MAKRKAQTKAPKTRRGSVPPPSEDGTQVFTLETAEYTGTVRNHEITLAIRTLLTRMGTKTNNSFVIPARNYPTARTIIRRDFPELKVVGRPTDTTKKFYRLIRLK